MGELHHGVSPVSDDYMSLYRRITRRWIVPPIMHPPSRGIQPTAGVMEIMYQGLCRGYKRFMRHGIDEGVAEITDVFTTLGLAPPDIDQPEASYQHESAHPEPSHHHEIKHAEASHHSHHTDVYIPRDVSSSEPSYSHPAEGSSHFVEQFFGPPFDDNLWTPGGLGITSYRRVPHDESAPPRRRRRRQSVEVQTENEAESSQHRNRGYRPVSGL